MPELHSLLSPSGASRWLACPGSLDLPQEEDTGSEYAREGTAAHTLASRCWMLDGDPAAFLGQQIDGFEVTQEMVDAVQLYLDTIHVKIAEMGGPHAVEVDMEIRIVHPHHPEFGGTIDCLLSSAESLAVVDFKYGAGVVVEAHENPQLACYLLLAMARSEGKKDPFELTVVQPRARHDDGPVRSWKASETYLAELMVKITQRLSGELKGKLEAGDHCKWCPAKPHCPAIKAWTIAMAQQEFCDDGLTPTEAAEILSHAKIIKEYLDSVTKWVHGQLDKGVEVPGYKLVETFGNRRYAIGEDEILRRCRKYKVGKKMIYKSTILSPAQLEKVVGKDVVALMVERPSKGTTVVPESDKRKAAVRQSANEEFGEVNDE